MRWRASVRQWTVAAWMAVAVWVGAAGQERKEFGAEGPLGPSVVLPAQVEKLLAREPDVRDTMRAENDGRVPRNWYEATRVQLRTGGTGARGTGAILVRGNCPLCGAHVGWFWIYEQARGRWRRLLFAVGDRLVLMDERRLGYRDVQLQYATADKLLMVEYRYDGKAYRESRSSEEKR